MEQAGFTSSAPETTTEEHPATSTTFAGLPLTALPQTTPAGEQFDTTTFSVPETTTEEHLAPSTTFDEVITPNTKPQTPHPKP